MTPKEFAAMLDGRTYRNEITKREEQLAAQYDLVVIFGASDDLAEIRGAVNDEANCNCGGQFFIDGSGVQDKWEQGDTKTKDEATAFFFREKLPRVRINVLWDREGGVATWEYEVGVIESAVGRFMITDDGENYCQGVVFQRPLLFEEY